jgi:hypothetical protein
MKMKMNQLLFSSKLTLTLVIALMASTDSPPNINVVCPESSDFAQSINHTTR